MFKIKTLFALILIASISFYSNAQHFIGVEYGALINNNLDSKGTINSNYSLLYKTYISKTVSLDAGVGMYKHDIESQYSVYDSATVQNYTKFITLHSDYIRIPVNFNFRFTSTEKRHGFVLILGFKLGYLLNKNVLTESYDVIYLNPNYSANSYTRSTVSFSKGLDINDKIKRFDFGYQIGGAYEINKILFGGLRFSLTYNGSLLEQFKSGSITTIQNGDDLTNFKWKWVNANVTCFFRISEKTSYLRLGNKKNPKEKIKAVY